MKEALCLAKSTGAFFRVVLKLKFIEFSVYKQPFPLPVERAGSLFAILEKVVDFGVGKLNSIYMGFELSMRHYRFIYNNWLHSKDKVLPLLGLYHS